MWSVFGAILSFIVGLFNKPKPSPEAVDAASAAESKTVAKVDAVTAQTQAKVAQAEVDAPETKAAVISTLNSGDF